MQGLPSLHGATLLTCTHSPVMMLHEDDDGFLLQAMTRSNAIAAMMTRVRRLKRSREWNRFMPIYKGGA